MRIRRCCALLGMAGLGWAVRCGAVRCCLRCAFLALFLWCAQVSDPTSLFLGNAGTAMRPLTAVMCAGKGEFVMDGTPRMRERPIVDLVDGLKQVERMLTPVCFCALRVSCGSVLVWFGLVWVILF